MSRIVKLEAENVKRLRAVSITPEGAVVTIRGDNGQGKTSVLDSIEYALAGEKSHPVEPIRRGAEKARVLLETDDGIVVERRWTAGSTRLEVRNKEGLKYSSPQKLLDGLTGKLTFDPLAFLREGKPERQAEILRQLVGVNLEQVEQKRRAVFETRTEANRRVAGTKARLEAIPPVEAPDAPVSAAELLEEQQRRTEEHTTNETKRQGLARLREEARRAGEAVTAAVLQVAQLEAELARARDDLVGLTKRREEIGARGHALRAEVDALAEPDLEDIPKKLREVEATNEKIHQKKARADLARELAAAEQESTKLSAEIEAIDRQKAEALAAAAFPVPGLGFGDGCVTLNGLPLSQASSAEQLRVSVAMGLALNPKMRVLLVRDGSLLDSKSLALITHMAEDAKAQVWLEVVGKGGVGVVIEDGQVEGVTREPGEEG